MWKKTVYVTVIEVDVFVEFEKLGANVFTLLAKQFAGQYPQLMALAYQVFSDFKQRQYMPWAGGASNQKTCHVEVLSMCLSMCKTVISGR